MHGIPFVTSQDALSAIRYLPDLHTAVEQGVTYEAPDMVFSVNVDYEDVSSLAYYLTFYDDAYTPMAKVSSIDDLRYYCDQSSLEYSIPDAIHTLDEYASYVLSDETRWIDEGLIEDSRQYAVTMTDANAWRLDDISAINLQQRFFKLIYHMEIYFHGVFNVQKTIDAIIGLVLDAVVQYNRSIYLVRRYAANVRDDVFWRDFAYPLCLMRDRRQSQEACDALSKFFLTMNSTVSYVLSVERQYNIYCHRSTLSADTNEMKPKAITAGSIKSLGLNSRMEKFFLSHVDAILTDEDEWKQFYHVVLSVLDHSIMDSCVLPESVIIEDVMEALDSAGMLTASRMLEKTLSDPE